MDYITAAGITVGILAGIWIHCSGIIAISTFAGFLGWASYFAAGGKREGGLRAACGNLSGVCWGLATLWVKGLLPPSLGLVVMMIAAAAMCWQAKIGFLSYIPATFIGNACFYANNADPMNSAVGLIIGIALGFLSDYGAQYVSRHKFFTRERRE